MKKCLNCGKEISDNSSRFCSSQCEEARIKELKKKMNDAVKSDPSHVKKLSES